jgi:hypothetical protein
MRRWKIVTLLMLGVLWMLACEEQARKAADETVLDSPVAGVWYLQAVSEGQPIAGDMEVRFEFKADGAALYERRTDGPEAIPGEPERFDLRYNLTGDLITIDSNSEDPGVPRVTGKIEVEEDGQTLRIKTHSDERWVLTREARPGGELEAARQVEQLTSRADPMLVRVQHVAYAVGRYEQSFGDRPGGLLDLVGAGLVSPELLTASGRASDLPSRYGRMTDEERSAWFDGNSAFALVGTTLTDRDRPRVVVTTVPSNNRVQVIVGMSNGSVHNKTVKQAAELVQRQGGLLPGRWPEAGWSADTAAGLEPLSD